MDKSVLEGQEGTDNRLFEDIYQQIGNSPGVGLVSCQVCGQSFSEGEDVFVYVYRDCGTGVFETGQVICRGKHELPRLWTLGVWELLVAGEVGSNDRDRNGSNRFVVEWPRVMGLSPPGSKSLEELNGGGVVR